MEYRRTCPAILLVCVLRGAGAQTLPPIRRLEPIVARTTDLLGGGIAIRVLSNGSVVVNEETRHRVVLFDSSLVRSAVVADSSPTSPGRSYGTGPSILIPYAGDSTVFADVKSAALVMIDPTGHMGRVFALPRPSDIGALLLTGGFGAPGFDAAGRLVYRLTPPRAKAGAPTTPDVASIPRPDSAPIVRGDLASHRVDTAAFVAFLAAARIAITRASDGTQLVTTHMQLLRPSDDWTVTSDGRIAILRGQDYHMDWIGADGVLSASPRIAHEWHRLTDAEKGALIDSAKRAIATDPAGTNTPANIRMNADFGDPLGLPDFAPPFVAGTLIADRAERLWVETPGGAPSNEGAVYDVIDRTGRLVDRVQLPVGWRIVGFGARAVYMSSREGTSVVLARAPLPRS